MACEIPVVAADERQVFIELARRQGDYAITGLAARAIWRAGALDQPRLAFLGLEDRPVRALQTERLLQGQIVNDALLARADQVLRGELQPGGDLTNSAHTKRHLAAVLMQRALRRLAAQPS